MKCPFLESEDCETCGYYDYVPEKKCYNCLHPFLNADDEKATGLEENRVLYERMWL